MQKKKLLGAALVLAMTVGQANAELFKGLKFGGQLDLQATAGRNVTDFRTNGGPAGNGNDRIGDLQTRVLLHADWAVLDDVSAKVTLRKNDRTWGNVGGANVAANGSQAVNTAGGTDVLGNIYVDQAYVKVDKLMGMDATLGRQFYGEAGDLVIFYGPSDKAQYGLPVRSLDAARFDWSNDMLGLTGVVAKIAGGDNNLGPQGTAATDLQGINAALKGQENLSAGAYVYRSVTHNVGALGTPPSVGAAGGVNQYLWIVGAKAKAMLGSAAWVGAEIAKNFGTQRQAGAADTAGSRNFTGYAFKADAGAKAEISGIGSLMPWLHFGFGTGDSDTRDGENRGFQAVRGDYRPGTIYGRFSGPDQGESLGAGVAGLAAAANGTGTLTNRVIVGGGVKVNPAAISKMTAGLSYWDFRSQTSAQPIGASRNRPFTGNKHIGSEIDLDLTWKHSDNVSVGAGAATFQPGGVVMDAIQSTTAGNASVGSGSGTNPIQLAYFDVRIKWGN